MRRVQIGLALLAATALMGCATTDEELDDHIRMGVSMGEFACSNYLQQPRDPEDGLARACRLLLQTHPAGRPH